MLNYFFLNILKTTVHTPTYAIDLNKFLSRFSLCLSLELFFITIVLCGTSAPHLITHQQHKWLANLLALIRIAVRAYIPKLYRRYRALSLTNNLCWHLTVLQNIGLHHLLSLLFPDITASTASTLQSDICIKSTRLPSQFEVGLRTCATSCDSS